MILESPRRMPLGTVHTTGILDAHRVPHYQPAFILREATADEWKASALAEGLPEHEFPEDLGPFFYEVSID